MFLDEKRSVYEALTRYNYFPNQKEGESELPPCFTTSKFTPELVEEIVKRQDSRERKTLGFDQVEYLLTRHNNVPRKLGLIHPKAYANLSKVIAENWSEINVKLASENSVIRPEIHEDGRILIMNYEDFNSKIKQASSESFAKRFRVHTDISSCYHSVYSHSFPWAAIGFKQSKGLLTKKSKITHWSEDLDFYTQKSKRSETLGVAIGPASSSIVVELVLACIDRDLTNLGFKFKRYIDDYVCYANTHEEAESFLRLLGKRLNEFKLNLNLHKTHIFTLPEPRSDDWVTVLSGCLPNNFVTSEYDRRKYTLIEIVNYLDQAVRLNKVTPDGSVLKYAIKMIINQINDSSVVDVLDYIINLAWHYPLIIPLLDQLLSNENVNASVYEERINLLIIESAKNYRSDGMAWALYYIRKFQLNISTGAYGEVIRSKDCIALVSLYRINVDHFHIVEFANSLLCKSDYEKDQYWILLYELYRDKKIGEVYEGDTVFKLMKSHGVTFIPEDDCEETELEKYCFYLSIPFPSMVMDPEDFKKSIFIDHLDYENWRKAPSGYLRSPHELIEVVLPYHMLSSVVIKGRWQPLVERLSQFIVKQNYYDWSTDHNFMSLLKVVIRVQLDKIDYPESSYDFTIEYIIEKSISFYR